MNILLPFDGSASANRALEYLMRIPRTGGKGPLTIDLINVQDAVVGIPASFARDAADVAEQLVKSAREAGTKLLLKPIEALKNDKLLNASTVLVGDPASIIAEYVKNNRCDAVVMGTRGLSPISGLVMGSVASKVIHLVKVPVTLVK
jgi:nucleotide-binding universal stress UspA family protein